MTELLVFALFFGIGFTATTGLRLALDLYRHGLDNHLCHRECCRFLGSR